MLNSLTGYTILTRYAIKHIPSGGFIPVPVGSAGRGGSHEEAIVFTANSKRMVRSWPTERGAKICLTSWLKGKVECDRGLDQGSNPEMDDNDRFYEENKLVPLPHRQREDMEIVTIQVLMKI